MLTPYAFHSEKCPQGIQLSPTLSNSNCAPALPRFDWLIRNGFKPQALSYPRYLRRSSYPFKISLYIIAIHDELNSRIREEHKFNHNHKSILTKGHGQLRIATAKWSIEQALVRLEERKNGDTVSPWSFIIPKHIILCAKRRLDYFIAQKFAFGCQISHYSDSTQSDDDQDHGTTITNHYTLNDQPGTHPIQG